MGLVTLVSTMPVLLLLLLLLVVVL